MWSVVVYGTCSVRPLKEGDVLGLVQPAVRTIARVRVRGVMGHVAFVMSNDGGY